MRVRHRDVPGMRDCPGTPIHPRPAGHLTALSLGVHITQLSITVRDYDEAIAFYTRQLGWKLLEDTQLSDTKRWVRVAPPRSGSEQPGPCILLARAVGPEQLASVGNQTGGRVFVFVHTDDLRRDHAAMTARGVRFIRPPASEPYGLVAVFEDLYGNKFDLIEPLK